MPENSRKRPTQNRDDDTQILDVTVQCLATYRSSIRVPKGLSLEEAVAYAKEHIGAIDLGTLQYVPDSDELDESCCSFRR